MQRVTKRGTTDEQPKAPELEQQDWEEVEGAMIVPAADILPGAEILPDDVFLEDTRDDVPNGELPEEDDDNPYQDSDEALPDDLEERVISRNPSKAGGRFDEV